MKRPEICRVTPYEGGETVQIFGENFTDKSILHYWRENPREDKSIHTCGLPGELLPELPPEGAKSVKIRNAVNAQVAYLGPEAEISSGVNVFWIENEAGFSKPFISNHPRLWSQSVTRIYPAGIVSVYGDCMWSSSNKHAYLKNIESGKFTEAQVLLEKSDMYYYGIQRHRTNIRIPADIQDGEYEIYIHAGTGGYYGWSNPLKIKIEKEYSLTEYFRTKWNRDILDGIPMPNCKIFAVNANPLGELYDITDEIEAAIKKAEDVGGGIVMLSAGTFGISRTLKLRDGVVLKGAGEGATIIKVAENTKFTTDWSDVSFALRTCGAGQWAADWKKHWQRYNHGVFVRIFNDAGVEGIKFVLGAGVSIGVLVANDTDDAHTFGAFTNFVTVDGSGIYPYKTQGYGNVSGGLITVGSNTELTAYKCSFIGLKPVYILPANNYYVRLINNLIQCEPKNYDESFINGVHYGTFIENDFVDGRRSFMSQMGFDNNFVYQNRSRGVTRGANANEVYMSEHGDALWGGYAESIGEDFVTIDRKTGLFAASDREDFSNESNGIYGTPSGELTNYNLSTMRFWLVVLKGRGFGQYREILSVDGNKLQLDKPWDIIPDEKTAFTVVTGTVNNLWIDNASELSNSHSQFIWNCGIENVISGHEINMSAGIRLYSNGFYGLKDTTCVLAFNRIVHSQVRGSGKGIWLNSDGYRMGDRPDYVRFTGGGVFANSVRACMFDGSRDMPYVKNLPHTMTDSNPHCGVAIGGGFNTFCRNRIGGYVNAVQILDDCLGNCLDSNYYWDNCNTLTGTAKPIGNDVSQQRIKM